MKNKRGYVWLDYAAISVVVLLFFVISRFGYLWGDDYAMGYGEVENLRDVFIRTKDYYFVWSGGVLGTAVQFLFCGLWGDYKILFDIVNTLVFIAFLTISFRLIRKNFTWRLKLWFVLLFWFVCPVPRETLFWMVGSTAYLWGTTLPLLFLLVYEEKGAQDGGLPTKLLLFVASLIAATSIFPCVSICGAFFLYYLFHLKKLKGNAVPLVAGFVVGTLVLLLAPGNFARMQSGEQEGFFLWLNLKDLVLHLPKEIIKFRAFWLLMAALLVGLRKDKKVTWGWVRSNWLLFLPLGWSVIAFSVVFRPYQRALFFTETVSLILLLRFMTDSSIKPLFENWSNRMRKTVGEKLFASRHWLVLSFLFVTFMVDAGFAIKETVRQKNNNNRLLSEIAAAGGVAAVDYPLSSHRMAYAPDYPKWSWPGIAYQLGLDSVHVYPYFCQDKYYRTSPLGDRVWLDKQGLADVDPNYHLSKNCMLFFRIPVEELQDNQQVVFKISYSRPHKWWKEWLDKYRNYVYERESVVRRDKPDEVFDGYNFYVVWFLKENAKNINAVEIEMHH